jgi:hypothetical protein
LKNKENFEMQINFEEQPKVELWRRINPRSLPKNGGQVVGPGNSPSE